MIFSRREDPPALIFAARRSRRRRACRCVGVSLSSVKDGESGEAVGMFSMKNLWILELCSLVARQWVVRSRRTSSRESKYDYGVLTSEAKSMGGCEIIRIHVVILSHFQALINDLYLERNNGLGLHKACGT